MDTSHDHVKIRGITDSWARWCEWERTGGLLPPRGRCCRRGHPQGQGRQPGGGPGALWVLSEFPAKLRTDSSTLHKWGVGLELSICAAEQQLLPCPSPPLLLLSLLAQNAFTVSEMLASPGSPSVLFICSVTGQLPDAAVDPLPSCQGPQAKNHPSSSALLLSGRIPTGERNICSPFLVSLWH